MESAEEPEEEDENESDRENDDDVIDSSDENALDSEENEQEDCGSDPEDMESGSFFNYIQQETQRAQDERRFIVYKLKSKTRVGSIFFDKVKRVIAAINREPGKYDFLVEWDYHKKDKLKPITSIVKGSHFVFAKPLLYRRYVEKTFLEQYASDQTS